MQDAINLLPNHRFPKSQRLLKTYQFRRVAKLGRTVYGKYLTIQTCESRALKLGITVSRKFGKAVQRNRFKRLVREAFRLSFSQAPRLHLNVRPTSKLSSKLTLEGIQQELKELIPIPT